MAGWKVLTGCLKQGGLMKIGLYSELARQKASAKIRDEISELGIGSSDAEMKLFREIIIKSEKVIHCKKSDKRQVAQLIKEEIIKQFSD